MDAQKIALCMITKNSAATIEQCLASVRPHVDGVFVYDTGSTDNTVAILNRLNKQPAKACTACGALATREKNGKHWRWRKNCAHADADLAEVPLAPIVVKKGEWRDDFAWAREQSYAMVPSGEYGWAVWADDDDTIVGAEWFRQLTLQAPPELDGFIFQYDYAVESGQLVCVLWRERLVRLDAGYRWINPVHEVQVPPDRPARLQMVAPEQCRWVHNRPPERYAPERNLEILFKHHDATREKGEEPDLRTVCYIGTELMARGRFAEALPWLEQYRSRDDGMWSDERCQVHHKLAQCLIAIGNPQAAVDIEMQCLRARDDWAETAVGLSLAFERLGQWDRAIRWAKRAVDLGVPRTPLIVNPLEFTMLPWATIANCLVQAGRAQEAVAAIQQALAAAPQNPGVQARVAEIRALAKNQEIAQALLFLREVLVRYDENFKAHMLMQHAVPYVVAERPEIVRARADQRAMVRHATDPDEYERWYRDEPKESEMPDEIIPEIGDHLPRARRLVDGLLEQEQTLGRKPRLLDLGCNDGWMAVYVWQKTGAEVVGLELNVAAADAARDRAARFDAPITIHQGNLLDAVEILGEGGYDAISLFEVIEHVPDVDQALDVMERLLAPGGIIYISTPNGAFERGNIDDWQNVVPKGHLRAIPIHDLCDLFQSRGEVVTAELQHDGRVTFAAYTPRPVGQHIVFYAGAGWEQWSPASIRSTGLGGSETALVQVAVRLARAGHKVTVYSGSEPCFAEGVSFRPITAWDPTADCDLLVSSRLPHVVDNPIGARSVALWCHDHSYPGQLTEERAAKIDHIVVLSEWQRDRFARLYPFAAGKLRLIRNGIAHFDADGTSRYPDPLPGFEDRKAKVLFSSSADRGLEVALQVWPRIRERVPDAELHVFYGWDVFDAVAIHNPQQWAYKSHVLGLIAQLGGEDAGIFMRGRVGQDTLRAEMLESRVWGYPTAFLETSCISAMEARAAGMAIVTSDLGALHETVGKHGILLPWAPDEAEPANQADEYQDRFVYHVVAMLTDRAAWEAIAPASGNAAGLDWRERTADWEALIPPFTSERSGVYPDAAKAAA